MKNIIDKSVIESKLVELEAELLALEDVFKGKLSTDKIEYQLIDDANHIEQQLSEIISCLDTERETHLQNDRYHTSHASCFPYIASNV